MRQTYWTRRLQHGSLARAGWRLLSVEEGATRTEGVGMWTQDNERAIMQAEFEKGGRQEKLFLVPFYWPAERFPQWRRIGTDWESQSGALIYFCDEHASREFREDVAKSYRLRELPESVRDSWDKASTMEPHD